MLRLDTIKKTWIFITVAMMLPAVVLIVMIFLLKKNAIDGTQRELQGLRVQHDLRSLPKLLTDHRFQAREPGSDEKVAGSRVLPISAEIFQAVSAVDLIIGSQSLNPELTAIWQQLKMDLNDLGSAAVASSKPNESDPHQQLIDRTLKFSRRVGEAAGLTNDAQIRNALLEDAYLDIQQLADLLRGLRADLAGSPETPDPKAVAPSMRLILGRMQALESRIQETMKSLYLVDPALKAKLEPASAGLLASSPESSSGAGFASRIAAMPAGTKPEKAAVEAQASAAEEVASQLLEVIHPTLMGELQGRIEQEWSRILALGLCVVGGLSLALAAAFAVSRRLFDQTEEIVHALDEIGAGNFDARARIFAANELGRIGISLNSMLDNFSNLIQSQSERDDIQQAIQKLMSEVADVASGDLTVEAEVTNDFTGSLADAINFMISQLRAIVSNVQEATLQVSSSANEIQVTTEYLSRGGDAQASQILETSAAIDEIATSIQQVAHNASEALTVAEQARLNATKGTEAVRDTIQGMDRIRDQVQETSKRIKRLGESSQEIGEIVQLIGDIADRTSILALNASIQAAMAGEAGLGFAVVAEEVERLAERSNEATKQIATLIKTIQSVTAEAVTAMEESTREVVSGSKVALMAGQALTEIDTVSNRVAEIIQSIAYAVKQQARGSEALSKSMSEISEVTQQTAAGTRQAAVSVSNLAKLADDLRASVSTFKLPSGHGASAGLGITSGVIASRDHGAMPAATNANGQFTSGEHSSIKSNSRQMASVGPDPSLSSVSRAFNRAVSLGK